MSDLLIRDLDKNVLARLKQAAATHHRSLASEARAVLTAAVAGPASTERATAAASVPTTVADRPARGSVQGLRVQYQLGEDVAPVFPVLI
jgi:plasmid stability protein